MSKPKLIVIIGPTASGKSDLAVSIAREIEGEIISADSRQVYKGMDIGAGKITTKEMQGIKHYLLDVANPRKIFTAVDFKNLAEKAIEEILGKNKIPIVCGGSGFYINVLLGGVEIPKVKPDWQLRKKLEKKTADELFKMLKKIDKERGATIDPKNKRRLIRAIEIAKALGRVPRLTKPGNAGKYNILWLGIKKSDKELRKRIWERLIKRLKRGMVSEVKKLHAKKGASWKRLDDLGLEYRYISRFLQNKISREEMMMRLNAEIVRYAKRQMTWFKKYAPKTYWIKNKNEAFGLVKKFI